MLRLIPKPAVEPRPAERPQATALVYTMLRHGRRLGHAEAARLLLLPLNQDRPAPHGDFDGPFQAA